MKIFATVIGGSLALAFGLVTLIILGTFFGGVTGWIVGWFFADTILRVFAQIGIHDVTMFQLGTFLGFLGGFIRSTSYGK